MTTSFPPWMVGLIVFGGLDPLKNFVLEESAFKVGFLTEACKAGLSCQYYPGGECLSGHTLTQYGYDSSVFKEEIDALQQQTNKIITEESTIEHCRALMKAGKKFSLISHPMTFISVQR